MQGPGLPTLEGTTSEEDQVVLQKVRDLVAAIKHLGIEGGDGTVTLLLRDV